MMISQSNIFDVAIVGAGPSGMFVAHKLLRKERGLHIAMLDKGKNVIDRSLEKPLNRYPGWKSHNLVSGAGGAGLFSDGKLILTLKAGGKLGNLLSTSKADQYIRYIEHTLISYDGYSTSKGLSDNLSAGSKACLYNCDIDYKHLPVRHFGSQNLKNVLIRFFEDLNNYSYFYAFFECNAVDIVRKGEYFSIYYLDKEGNNRLINTRKIVFAVGKEGSPWLVNMLQRYGVKVRSNRTFFGVRIETNFSDEITKLSFDPKFYWHFDDGTKIKSHCFCRRGQVLLLQYFGLPLAGGHTPFTEKNSVAVNSYNTNFGILLGDTPESKFTWAMCLGYMKAVDNLTKGKLLVQRFGDFLANRATAPNRMKKNSIKPSLKPVSFGNIASLNLPFDFNKKFISFAEKLSLLDSELFTQDALLYAPAIEWWMPKIDTDNTLETSVKGVYVIGDGAGFSQGIMYAATTGLVAADSILESL